MKRKTKKLAYVIVAILLIAIAATGCNKADTKTEDSNKTETKTADNNKKETVEENKEESNEEKVVPFEKGVRTDTTYESKWMNMRFTVPEGYRMASEEEMAQTLETGEDVTNLTEEQKEAMEQVKNEMTALNDTDGSNVNVIVEKLSVASVTEEQYLQISSQAMKEASAELSFENAGEIADTELGGQTLKKIGMTASIQGVTLNQELYAKKIGDHMVIITMTTLGGQEAARDTLISAFQPLS